MVCCHGDRLAGWEKTGRVGKAGMFAVGQEDKLPVYIIPPAIDCVICVAQVADPQTLPFLHSSRSPIHLDRCRREKMEPNKPVQIR